MLRLPFHHCNHQFVFYTCDSVSLLCAFFWFYFRFHISVITQSIWLSEISYLTYFTKSNTPRYSLGSFTLLQKAEFHSFLWLNNMRCDSWGRKESDMTEWLNWTEPYSLLRKLGNESLKESNIYILILLVVFLWVANIW